MVECTSVLGYNYVLFQSENKKLFPVDLETDVDLTFVEVDDLSEVIKFIIQDSVWFFQSWLQFAQYLGHEFPVALIVPTVVVMLQI